LKGNAYITDLASAISEPVKRRICQI